MDVGVNTFCLPFPVWCIGIFGLCCAIYLLIRSGKSFKGYSLLPYLASRHWNGVVCWFATSKVKVDAVVKFRVVSIYFCCVLFIFFNCLLYYVNYKRPNNESLLPNSTTHTNLKALQRRGGNSFHDVEDLVERCDAGQRWADGRAECGSGRREIWKSLVDWSQQYHGTITSTLLFLFLLDWCLDTHNYIPFFSSARGEAR